MIRYRDAVFAATHNSYAGGPRGDLQTQLDAGVRGLELDVVRHASGLLVGHGLPGLDVSHDGANPNDDRLESWLRRLAAVPDAGPLTLVLDLKSKLTSEAGPGSVTALLDLLHDVFGARLLPADDPAALARPVSDLRDRVVAVASGSRRTRERLLADPGRDPVLAADAHGRVLEVHVSPRGRALWWWCGADDGRALRWHAHGRLPSRGDRPALAMAPDGFFALVSTPDAGRRGDAQLTVRAGRLDADGRPRFERARRLGWGDDVRLRWRDGFFHVSFRAAATGDRVHKRGVPAPDGRSLTWAFAPPRPEPPADPAAAVLTDGATAAVRRDDATGRLQWRRGPGPWTDLSYRPLLWVERQPNDPVALQRAGLAFCACPATSRAWGTVRRAEGCLVRVWQVTERTMPAAPVNFPATDTPYAAWYLRYLQDVGGEA